ncbi:FecR domain-containing protein [Pedobacter sp. ASV1-7]|uniref:FecR family protein n=1 Tax=Pedobacter sp. ASV1-7 TaxID=3145237 RepID=UPI0032E9273B
MNDDVLQKLVKKYLNDECSPQEIQRLHEWYNSFDEDQDIIDFLTPEQLQQLRQRLISRIRKNISADLEASQAIVNRNRSSNKNTYIITGIAATVLLVVGLFLFRSSDTISPLRSMSAEIVVFNTSKSIQKVMLEDSSIVWLNPNSKIVYPRKFLAASRELHMHGEAFFEVTPDANRPFIIYSDNIVTRVWGTSFLVRSVEGVQEEVSVVTGKVSVRLQEQDDNAQIMLTQDQKATFFKADNLLKKGEELKKSPVRIWQKTTLSFDNVPLRDVLKILNKKFMMNINSTDESLLNYSLTADFTDQSLPAILEMLEKSLNLKYEINDNQIILNN